MVAQRGLLMLVFAAAAAGPVRTGEPAGYEQELHNLRREMERLREELRVLQGEERGILGEVDRLGGEQRLREAELREVTLRLQRTVRAVSAARGRLGELERHRERTRRYLGFRLREVYKRGPAYGLRLWVGGRELESYLRALGYAAWLGERDARALRAYRQQAEQLRLEAERLARERSELAAAREQAQRARTQVDRLRGQRARVLAAIQRDRSKREQALVELDGASRALTELVAGLGTAPPALNVRRFRGLLDPPVAGAISAGFGTMVHPRFRTEVPHPGLDIEADAGVDFRAAFDGTVRFASWLRGYGLTVIVDHGQEVLSIYAHASVLLVEKGQHVKRGQVLGKVGDTGSLRGPYLYFEIRERGRPVDPATWLRPW